MRRRYFLLVLLVTVMVYTVIAAFAPVPAQTAQSESPNKITQTAPQGSWETLVKEAQKEGKVVIYGSASGDTSGQLSKAFKKKYGLNLEFVLGKGQQVSQKLLAERRAGLYLADVGLGSPGTFFNILDPANIAVPLDSLLVLDEVKDTTKWRTGKLPFLTDKRTIIATVAIVSPSYAINTKMVKDNEITSLDDVLAPRWKNKIIIDDPTMLASGVNWFTFVMTIAYGPEKGTEYMRKLIAQQPVIIRDERLVVESVAKGKYPMGVGLKSTIVASFTSAGAPIKFVTIKEGGPVTSGVTNLWVYDKAPHPNAAKVFLNWLLTKEAGEIIAQTSGYPSERVDVSKQGFDPAFLPRPTDITGGRDYYLNQGKMLKVAGKIFKDLLK